MKAYTSHQSIYGNILGAQPIKEVLGGNVRGNDFKKKLYRESENNKIRTEASDILSQTAYEFAGKKSEKVPKSEVRGDTINSPVFWLPLEDCKVKAQIYLRLGFEPKEEPPKEVNMYNTTWLWAELLSDKAIPVGDKELVPYHEKMAGFAKDIVSSVVNNYGAISECDSVSLYVKASGLECAGDELEWNPEILGDIASLHKIPKTWAGESAEWELDKALQVMTLHSKGDKTTAIMRQSANTMKPGLNPEIRYTLIANTPTVEELSRKTNGYYKLNLGWI